MARVGEVVAVFRKPRKGGPVVAVERIECRRGVGIVDDANAAPDSPRQVLLAAEEAEADLGLAPGALWENVTTAGFDLDALPSGTRLQLGPAAVVALTYVCEPCQVIKAATGVSLQDLTGRRGMVAVVLDDGAVTAGDPVTLLEGRLPALPKGYLDRCRLAVAAIPPGQVLTYDGLIAAIGGPSRLRKTLPEWLVALADDGLPAHRVVAGTEDELDADHARRLADEGVALSDGRVAQAPFRRPAEDWYLSA